MAEVLSPLSPSSSTITMLHAARPAPSDVFQSPPAPSSYQQPQRLSNTPRSIYNASSGYRGLSSAPIQPYAFQSTPHLRQETRTTSAPSVPQHQSSGSGLRHGHRKSASTSTVSSDMSSAASANAQPNPSKDDLFAGSARNSFINLSSSIPDLSLTPFDNAPKASPNRYRRTPQRADSSNSVNRVASPTSAAPSGSGMASVDHLYTPPPPVLGKLQRTASDDLTISKTPSSSEAAKRYRRRSLNSLETSKLVTEDVTSQSTEDQRPVSHSGQAPSTIRPVSFHSRTSSTESANARRAPSSTPSVSSDLNQCSHMLRL